MIRFNPSTDRTEVNTAVFLSKYLLITVNKLTNGLQWYSCSPMNGYLALITPPESQICH